MWELLRDGSGQLRVAGNGIVIGLGISALLVIAEARHLDPDVTARLLLCAEAGAMMALARVCAGGDATPPGRYFLDHPGPASY